MNKNIHLASFVPLIFSTLFGAQGTADMEISVLAQKELSLENRHADKFVNDVFKDNILLNLAYLSGKVSSKDAVNWDEIRKPFLYEFRLKPNEAFAYHGDVYEKYRSILVKTTNAHFNAEDGFKTDGYLYGDGICHLASIIYWTALEAGLEAAAPTNHDFAPIPDVPKIYGVSIYFEPSSKEANVRQNLYIVNNKDKPVAFRFEYNEGKLKVSVAEVN